MKRGRFDDNIKIIRQALDELERDDKGTKNLQKQIAELQQERDALSKTADDLQSHLYEVNTQCGIWREKYEKAKRDAQAAQERTAQVAVSLEKARVHIASEKANKEKCDILWTFYVNVCGTLIGFGDEDHEAVVIKLQALTDDVRMQVKIEKNV